MVYNVGYLGNGKYKSKYLVDSKWKHTKQYLVWRTMIMRCYDVKYSKKHPTYKDCTVCEEWHNFQTFAKWFDENYYEIENTIMDLDKDILKNGNKIYCPKYCVFVPQQINKLFTLRTLNRGAYPLGCHLDGNKFTVKLNKFGNEVLIGRTNNINEAFSIYKYEKEKYVKEVADLYKDNIPLKLYEALYKYQVNITD